MSVETRRVRTVALNAPSESLVHRGATMLADALRTATLPGATPGRVLIVRSLDVGDIHPEASPATLALVIERQVARLEATAVRYEDASAAWRAAVFFEDDAEPYVALALRLARRQPVDAWFWPLAVPCWRAAVSRAEGLRAILFDVLRTRAGPGALLRLVDELSERDAIDPLLETLRISDGDELLRALGWSKRRGRRADDDVSLEPATAYFGVERRWVRLLERWLTRWPAADARAIWLTTVAQAAEQPSRLGDPNLLDDAYDLLRHVASRARMPADREGLPRGASSLAESSPGSGHARSSGQQAADAERRRGEGGPSVPRAADADARAPREGRRGDVHAETAHAGLWFVIPIMTRLGMANFLESHPSLVETDFARRVLDRLGERLAIPSCDAARAAIGRIAAPTLFETDFTVPSPWLSGIARGDELIIRRWTDRGSRLLFDRSGTLPVALWRGRAPAAVRALTRGARLRRGGAMPAGETDVDVLVGAWLAAARRWSRRHAGMGLGALVRQTGRVTATRTHVDVELLHRDADVRIRRTGLDLDPGWVPWLGRVVRFHYCDE